MNRDGKKRKRPVWLDPQRDRQKGVKRKPQEFKQKKTEPSLSEIQWRERMVHGGI